MTITHTMNLDELAERMGSEATTREAAHMRAAQAEHDDGIRDQSKKHLYDVGTHRGKIEVDANTRAEARRIAERAGYVVYDVNMVG